MSKIEKALAKARRDKGLALVPTTPRESASEAGRELTTVQHVASGDFSVADGEALTRASEAIARMRELDIRSRGELADSRIIYPEMTGNGTVQAFREIRTKILQRTKGRNGVIMVTSVTGGGGSTFVSLNLGAAFAFDAGKTALLIDCNLRNPWLQKLLKDESPTGLMDYLENKDVDLSGIIHPVGIERLRVIPAGGQRDVPAEYFTSPRFKRMFDNIRRRYAERFVILDAPPMTDSADTKILAELCDYVLLVVPYGRVTQAQIDESIKSVDGEKFLGVVFNNEPRPPDIDWRSLANQSVHLAARPFRAVRAMMVLLISKLKSANSA
jgi:capsular exopolysaccharide synthesis family protein